MVQLSPGSDTLGSDYVSHEIRSHFLENLDTAGGAVRGESGNEPRARGTLLAFIN